tara:strand:- start:13906 stop:14958 length:1053 start_codon:yes stop_codon:yes gene_type:complete
MIIIRLLMISLIISSFGYFNKPKESFKLIAVGDMMIGTNFPSEKYLPQDNGEKIFENVKSFIKNADIAFGNLEGTILSGEGEVKKCSDIKKCYAFKSPDSYVDIYKDTGFDILSLANNHINDFGEIGRKNTEYLLRKNNIHYSGTTETPYSTFYKNNTKFGFVSFSPNKGTIQINNYNEARRIIKLLKETCDIVIVSFHGGGEGIAYSRVTREREYFLGEDRGNPYEFSRMAIDAGADIVLGHGPHVLRAVDLYKDKFIAYSLGNFATYARFNLNGIRGLSPLVEIEIDNDGKFLGGKIISAKQIGLGIPVIDKTHEAAKEIARLTKIDFPESKLEIDFEGNISINPNSL